MGSARGLKGAGEAFLGLFRPKSARVVTHIAEEGGATARAVRQSVAHDIAPPTPPKGAGLVPYTPKAGPPTTLRNIDPDRVIIDVTTPAPRRPPVDLNPAVPHLARGLKWSLAGAGVGLAALGLGHAATSTGEAVYRANEEQAPYFQVLPDGRSVFVMDPVTGETYLLIEKQGGWDVQDSNGSEGGPGGGGGGGGYGAVELSDGGRAEAEAARGIFSLFRSPWATVALVILAGLVIYYFAAYAKKGRGARASVKAGAKA